MAFLLPHSALSICPKEQTEEISAFLSVFSTSAGRLSGAIFFIYINATVVFACLPISIWRTTKLLLLMWRRTMAVLILIGSVKPSFEPFTTLSLSGSSIERISNPLTSKTNAACACSKTRTKFEASTASTVSFKVPTFLTEVWFI